MLFFIQHGGNIKGQVLDPKRRRSPIPSGGLEIKLQLTFTAMGSLNCKMRRLLAEAYAWDYNGQQTERNLEDNDVASKNEDSEEL